MDHFKLVSEYSPNRRSAPSHRTTCSGFKEVQPPDTACVTGSGKTFTMANVIQELNKPTLIIAHTQDTCSAVIWGV